MEEQRRKEWHEYYVKNKERFTASKSEAEGKDKIYVENRESIAESCDWQNKTLSQEEGENLEFHYGWSYNEND